ncbi:MULTISPECIES: group II intron maturase-specific domain-containing protein [unclassified Streptomyces]|uniref:group II intron maturase-specific domain-containing protein n=1 Tax=unclassified Streptomyces TaxID=2593676 RepID=UPI0023668CED|nr:MULTISPECIES: group II intron maturase-specific domain-containing protein [unclassified Streptomyces]MDF3142081.1 group II intron maturase-specific domain-containing protein [Streptomyces sp. T21Q-yed]WDF43050.1 group II intron maturase-specific domain-containing protein [Streptomyces sp. T12]
MLRAGVISPLLANVYVHRPDRAWSTREHGVLVRYADDAVVMCASREQAEAALERLRSLLAQLDLEPKAAKTRIEHLPVSGEGFDFLGFHHRWVALSRPHGNRRPVAFLARWPSARAMQHARDRIRELTDRRRLLRPVKVIVEDVNAFLRGWAAYFRFGNSAHVCDQIGSYARMRIGGFLAKKHRRTRKFGWAVVAFAAQDSLGLIALHGTVVAPRPFPDWRGRAGFCAVAQKCPPDLGR